MPNDRLEQCHQPERCCIRKPLPILHGWNRLEGRPRITDFERSLRAEVRDPLWFLTRQWQFGEFQGEDAASPIDVALGVRSAPLATLRIGADVARVRPGCADRDARGARAGAVRLDAADAGVAVSRAAARAARRAGLSSGVRRTVSDRARRRCRASRMPTQNDCTLPARRFCSTRPRCSPAFARARLPPSSTP